MCVCTPVLGQEGGGRLQLPKSTSVHCNDSVQSFMGMSSCFIFLFLVRMGEYGKYTTLPYHLFAAKRRRNSVECFFQEHNKQTCHLFLIIRHQAGELLKPVQSCRNDSTKRLNPGVPTADHTLYPLFTIYG